MSTLSVQVRTNGDYLEGFFYDAGRLACFSFSAGHNDACEGYRLRGCRPVPAQEAAKFVALMQAYYDSLPEPRVTITPAKRLLWSARHDA